MSNFLNNMTNDIILSSPIWGLVLFSFVPLLFKIIFRKTDPKPSWAIANAFVGLSFSLAASCFIVFGKQGLAFSKLLLFSSTATLSFIIIISIAILTLPLFLSKSDDCVLNKFFSEYMFLFLNSVAGLLLIISSNNLIATFIAVEHISLCFYLMIPMARDTKASIESSVKYFILGSVAACIFLLGLALILMTTGSLSFFNLLSQAEFLIDTSRMFAIGIALIFLALLFKVSIFPFQFWLPDVYQGSSTSLVAFMSVAVKGAVFFVIIKMILLLGWSSSQTQYYILNLLQWLAVLSLLIGHLSALLQSNLKRLLIYSSIAHAGYMLMALFLPGIFSVANLIYYMMFYAIANIGALAFIMLFEKDNITGPSVNSIRGLFKTHPFYALGFTWFLINLAGLPPSAGFFAKFFIFEDLVNKDLMWSLLWAALGSAIALYYYIKPIVLMFSEPDESSRAPEDLPWIKFVLIFLFVLSLPLTVGAGWIHQWIIEIWTKTL